MRGQTELLLSDFAPVGLPSTLGPRISMRCFLKRSSAVYVRGCTVPVSVRSVAQAHVFRVCSSIHWCVRFKRPTMRFCEKRSVYARPSMRSWCVHAVLNAKERVAHAHRNTPVLTNALLRARTQEHAALFGFEDPEPPPSMELVEDALKMPFTVFSTAQKNKMLKWYSQFGGNAGAGPAGAGGVGGPFEVQVWIVLAASITQAWGRCGSQGLCSDSIMGECSQHCVGRTWGLV